MAAFAEEGLEEISEDEKLAIVSQFLLASPPGEIKEVLTDVRSLCPEDLLTDDVLSGVFRTYNKQSNQVLTKGSLNVICDDSTEIDHEHLMDFSTGKVIRVDHITQEVEDDDVADVAPVESSAELQEKREAVEHEVMQYASVQFVKGTTAVNVAVKNGCLVVLISGEKLNLKNYWSGRWQSKFVVDLGAKSMDGQIKIRVHYFEDGNVQMTTEKSVDGVSLSFSDAASLAKAVRNAVSQQEGVVQNSLEEMYVNMSKETFKDMRRVLPITRQKMDWSGAQMQLAKGFAK